MSKYSYSEAYENHVMIFFCSSDRISYFMQPKSTTGHDLRIGGISRSFDVFPIARFVPKSFSYEMASFPDGQTRKTHGIAKRVVQSNGHE
jgi:hypothetical protein